MNKSNSSSRQNDFFKKKPVKIVMIVLSCVIVVGIAVLSTVRDQTQQAAAAEKEARYVEKVQPLIEEKDKLKKELSDLKKNYAEKVNLRNAILLMFDNCDESAYNNCHAVLEEHDRTGIIVFDNGAAAGDPGKLSKAHYTEMKNQGWDFALGDNSNIKLEDCLSAEMEPFVEWKSYVKSSVDHMKSAGMSAPTIYRFTAEIPRVLLDPIEEYLKSLGFNTMILTGNNSKILSVKVDPKDFNILYSKNIYENGSNVSSLMSLMANSYNNVAVISTRNVSALVEDRTKDCSTTRYKRMLVTLEEGGYYSDFICLSYSKYLDFILEKQKALAGEDIEFQQKSNDLANKIKAIEDDINKIELE